MPLLAFQPQISHCLRVAVCGGVAILLIATFALASELPTPTDPVARGYHWLTEKPYLPADFDQETFDEVYRVWPYKLREQAKAVTPAERRTMAYARYGLDVRPDFETGKSTPSGAPLQYVVDAKGGWAMNCFGCHGGSLGDQVIPGLPNANFEMQTLVEELRFTKLILRKPLVAMDTGSLIFPLGSTKGLTNAVMFGVAVMNTRDKDLNLVIKPPKRMTHHDMDPPAWWNIRKRDQIYIDGFAQKGVRGLMQFMLVPENGPEKFREWESDFADILAFMEAIPSPKYPYPIDRELAAVGRAAFHNHCAECHGSYAKNEKEETYPSRVIPIDDIGTDRVRWESLNGERHLYGESWFTHYGKHNTDLHPVGYLAPPLDGVWASSPYFHNGSVPTLEEVLHPSSRPSIWRRTDRPYDQAKVGLSVDRLDEAPDPIKLSRRARRHIYDTGQFGKSSAGHDYPDALTLDEKRAVLEYLKTL